MSGRVLVNLPDGRFVRGYRKTLVQRARRQPTHVLPDWRLSCLLPDDLRFIGLTEGACPGVLGIKVGPGCITIAGKQKDWMIEQLVRYVRKVAADWTGNLSFCLDRETASVSGPRHLACLIKVSSRGAMLVQGTSMRLFGV